MILDRFIIRVPQALRRQYEPVGVWRVVPGEEVLHTVALTDESTVALTFDDGPVPEQTPWVLDRLAEKGVKATFFCVGDNIRKHPDIARRIIEEGHAIGNHTFNHLQLVKNSWSHYVENIYKSQQVTADVVGLEPVLFRPPHGQIMPWHARSLTEGIEVPGSGGKVMKFDRLVFWDVMPIDYDRNKSTHEVVANVENYRREGSVIVVHDSIKASERMRAALEHILGKVQC